MEIIKEKINREYLRQHMLNDELVKCVVDCDLEIMAAGGQMHADEEQLLLENGSKQENLWGINLYLDDKSENWIEFDSMINIRPIQGNRSRSVEDQSMQNRIKEIVFKLVN